MNKKEEFIIKNTKQNSGYQVLLYSDNKNIQILTRNIQKNNNFKDKIYKITIEDITDNI